MSAGELTWAAFRSAMPIVPRWAYFDHAAVAPLPGASADAIGKFAREAAAEGDTVWPLWHAGVQEARTLGAQLLGANQSEVALVRSTTEGITLVAEGYPWQVGDNVVTLANEFPSNQYPWLNLASRGVEVRRVAPESDGRVDLTKLREACDARTRIVSVSWVGFATGYRLDLSAVSDVVHRAGALLLVDAIQGLGVFPIDVQQQGIDFLAADGHKWLLGPEGAGLFYVRSEHLERLRPLGVGWNSVIAGHDFNQVEMRLRPTATRYEGGSPNTVGFLALAESLRLLLSYGPERIGPRVLEITSLACERLASIGAAISSPRGVADHSSGIVSFGFPDQDPMELRKRALTAGVVTSCRLGRLRISPHAYNEASDIDRLCDALV